MATTIPDVWRAWVRKVSAEELAKLARTVPGCHEIALNTARLYVLPGNDEEIGLLLVKGTGDAYESMVVCISPAEAGAVIFAFEQAAECIEQRKERERVLERAVAASPTFDQIMRGGPGVVL